jgi:hypothetical protein
MLHSTGPNCLYLEKLPKQSGVLTAIQHGEGGSRIYSRLKIGNNLFDGGNMHVFVGCDYPHDGRGLGVFVPRDSEDLSKLFVINLFGHLPLVFPRLFGG